MTTLTLPEFEARCVRIIKALRFTEPVVPTEEIVETMRPLVLQLLAAQRDWQPIETAPRDGRRLLVMWPHWRHEPVIAFCAGDYETWHSEVALSDDGPGPTHWRPLPEPPEGTAP